MKAVSIFRTITIGFVAIFWTGQGWANPIEDNIKILAKFEVPSDKESVFKIGSRARGSLNKRFKLLNWNIEKAKQGENWANDFSKLVPRYDIVVLQEVEWTDLTKRELVAAKPIGWTYFTMWRRTEDKSLSGLVMGSKVAPITESFQRTEDREPFIKTPKMTTYQTFKVKGLKSTETLLVANIHAINFVSKSKFRRHIEQVVNRVQSHVGPVIFIGDMNTWSSSRFDMLIEMTSSVGLQHFDFPRTEVPGMHATLDHVFARGLKIHSVGFLDTITTSDHFPIAVDAEILK